ncbi:MAG: zinc dependent phospholipase C family protein [Deltaproteobacteria bacterium]
MPDMFAHYLVAEAAAQRAGAARLLADAFDAYKVGAQGPDVFFYSRLVRGRRGRPNLAHVTHQQQIAAAFRSMLARAAALPAGERGAAFAFVAGYAAHLCLDAEAHPWVLYWTGDITDGADPASKAEAFRRHGILEASIDVILTRERSDDTAWLRRQRLLRLPPAQAMTAATLLSGMLSDVYGVTFTPAEGRSAFRAMEWVYTTMTDPRALPTRLLGMVAPAVDKGGVVRTQIYPVAPAPAAARLYAGRSPWYYPSRPGEPCTASFAEIVETATSGTARCLRAITAVADRDAAVDEAVAVIGDRSMFTGVACDDPRPLVAFAPDREQLWSGV